jgi:glycosyltransferase involved in cell wall biosynthesis
MSAPRPRILDIVNTDHAALNFLAFRVGWINRNTEFQNDIVCSPGPHLKRIALRGTQVTAMDIPRGMSPTGVGVFLARLVRHLRTNSYAIVHTHNSITGAVGRIAARLAHVPLTIHTTHGFHFHENMGKLQRLPYVTAERWLSRWCDLLLCQNRQELDEIRRLHLTPRQGAYHVGNGINLRRFRKRTKTPNNPRPVILCVARLEPVKNHTQLFTALKALQSQFHPQVWLVGDGPSRAQYEAELRANGLADTVQFLGYRYDIPELIAAADVAVLTSVKEGIPRSLMEAMAVGLPVVATDVKGSREVVVDHHTGFLVPLGNAGVLAERLSRLLESPALRHEMGARAAEHARRHFDEERVVERLVWIYRTALGGQGLSDEAERVTETRLQASPGQT